MANSREAPFQRDIIEAMTAHGRRASTAGGYDLKGKDVSELELTHFRLIKREEKRLRFEAAEGDYRLTPFSKVGSGELHDPETQRLAETINRLNELCGAKVFDGDKMYFANGITGRIERDEAVMAQVRHHREDGVTYGLCARTQFCRLLAERFHGWHYNSGSVAS